MGGFSGSIRAVSLTDLDRLRIVFHLAAHLSTILIMRSLVAFDRAMCVPSSANSWGAIRRPPMSGDMGQIASTSERRRTREP